MLRSRLQLPPVPSIRTIDKEISDFQGMNNTDHPTNLKENQLTNLLNSFFDNGILTKRGGTTLYGDYLTLKHSEEFTATTYKDAANTTGEWTTDGAANLFANTTAALATSASSFANGVTKDRHTCISSNGTIFLSYLKSDTGIVAVKSVDNGANWTKLAGGAGTTTITSKESGYWSIWIDGSDHIHITYESLEEDIIIRYVKLTYSGGSWTVGSVKTVISNYNMDYLSPSICVTSGGTIWVSFDYAEGGYARFFVYYSSDSGVTWSESYSSAGYGITDISSFDSAIILNNDQPFVIASRQKTTPEHQFKIAEYNGSSWTASTLSLTNYDVTSKFSITRLADDSLWLVCKVSDGIKVLEYNGSEWTNTATLTSSINDSYPTITTDGTNLWAIWAKYEAANQYELTYKKYNGTSWEATSTDLTSDNGYNILHSAPLTISGYTVFPYTWRTGTGTTKTLKAKCVQLSGVIQSSGYNSATGSQTYSASVASTAGTGGTITTKYADCTTLSGTYSSFTSDISTLNKQYIKFKSTLTTTNLATLPSIDKVEITYGGVKVVGLHNFTRNDGAKYFLTVAGAVIYLNYSDGTKQSIKTGLGANLPTTATAFGNALLITNGTDAVMRFNGKVSTGTVTTVNGDATITGSGTQKWKTASNADELAATGKMKLTDGNWYTISSITDDTHLELTANYAGTGGVGESYEAYAIPSLAGSPSPPTGKYIETHSNFVFITGNSTYPTRLYFSDVGDMVTWPVENLIDINTNDGQVNTGLKSLRDVLGIFKYDSAGTKKSVHGLFGAASDEFVHRQLTTEYGGISGHSIVSSGNAVYFLDSFGIVETDFSAFRRIDNLKQSNIENTVKNWNHQYLNASYGIFFDDNIFFAIPYSASATNNYLLQFNLVKRGWSIHTGINPGCFAIYADSYTPELYFGDQTLASAVFKWNSGTSDNEQPINWQVETIEYFSDDYFRNKKFKYLYLSFDPTGAYNVTVYYSVDGNTAWTQLAETVETDSGTDEVVKRWNLSGVSGSTIKFKFSANDAESTISLVRIRITAIPKTMRRY